MKALSALVALLFVLSACASGGGMPATKYSAYCKTHATKVTLDGSPDAEAAFRNCMNLEGVHEIEITKSE